MRAIQVLAPAFGVFMTVGCLGADDEAIDGEADRYIVDGKADTGGIQEGTAEAGAVLFVASTFSRADLVNDVGLATKAADNILAYRNGDDETASTADDEKFESLAELDAVPFIGPIAFGKLLAYAQANDLVEDAPPPAVDDPFDPAACQGPAMSMQAAEVRWAANHRLGTYQLQLRKRTCTTGPQSTCQAWQAEPLTEVWWAPQASGVLELGKWDGEIRLAVQAGVCGSSPYSSQTYIIGTVCDGVGESLYCSGYDVPRRCYSTDYDWRDARLLWDNTLITMNGKLTENCVQLISKKTVEPVLSETRTEYEAAILKRF